VESDGKRRLAGNSGKPIFAIFTKKRSFYDEIIFGPPHPPGGWLGKSVKLFALVDVSNVICY